MTGGRRKPGKKAATKPSTKLVKVLKEKKNNKFSKALNTINIRNRNMRIRMNTTITPQKIEQMKMFLCLNKNFISKLSEKQIQTLKKSGSSSSCYRVPNSSMAFDLAKHKLNNKHSKNQVDFLRWQMKRMGSVGRTSGVDCVNMKTKDSFNGRDIINVVEKLNHEKKHYKPSQLEEIERIISNASRVTGAINTHTNVLQYRPPTIINSISNLIDQVYQQSQPDFNFKSPLKL